MTPPISVLYVAHGHAAVRPFGAEVYAHELYQAARRSPHVTPFLLSRVEPGQAEQFARDAPGSPLRIDPADPHQWRLETRPDEFDSFFYVLRNPELVSRWLPQFLKTLRPDVVHFHHTLNLGLELLTAVRTALPAAAILYTLHDFYPICAHRGLLTRTTDRGLCSEAVPAACRRCFPDISEASFERRAALHRDRFRAVDLFVAPSRCLAEHFGTWGVPREKILVEENGRNPPPRVAPPRDGTPRNRFAFFGQLNPFKGLDVLLEAAARAGAADLSVAINGAGLEMQAPRFREHLARLFAAAGSRVTDAGPYTPAELPDRMAGADWVVVPSVWWENSPLVIQEAFAHGRPVICSDVGGMAEKVRDGVDGLHFRVGDASSLAETMSRAAAEPALWHRLRGNIREPRRMSDHLDVLFEAYQRVIADRRRDTLHR